MYQILAWNGGGASNYTEIVKQGNKQYTPVTATVEIENQIDELFEAELKELKGYFAELKETAKHYEGFLNIDV